MVVVASSRQSTTRDALEAGKETSRSKCSVDATKQPTAGLHVAWPSHTLSLHRMQVPSRGDPLRAPVSAAGIPVLGAHIPAPSPSPFQCLKQAHSLIPPRPPENTIGLGIVISCPAVLLPSAPFTYPPSLRPCGACHSFVIQKPNSLSIRYPGCSACWTLSIHFLSSCTVVD